jgi:SpoVK/Ycf46/Vps4 family AAA+-type ATPase
MKKINKKMWAFQQKSIGSFYSIDAPVKFIYNYTGDGSKKPTPKELLEIKDKVEKEFTQQDQVYVASVIYQTIEGLVFSQVLNEDLCVTLPDGIYKYSPIERSSWPERLVPIEIRDDEYVSVKGISNDIIRDIKWFVENEALYSKLNIMYKYGLLLYGPPGEGKTSLIRDILSKHMPEGAVAIMIGNKFPEPSFMNHIKLTLKDRFKIFVFEEISHLTSDRYHCLEQLLSFLDGEDSMNKSIIIGTTNYPEQLPGNIVNRPSRFDKIYKVGSLSEEDRTSMLTRFLLRAPTASEVINTYGKSTAMIKEICTVSHKRQCSLDEATIVLEKQAKIASSDFMERKGIGIQ